jgi:hypothetical protein
LWIDSGKLGIAPANPPLFLREVRLGYDHANANYGWPVQSNDLIVLPDYQDHP